MFKMTRPKLVKIRCPDCNSEEEYIIDEDIEVVCCYECFKLLVVEYRDMNQVIVNNFKNKEDVVFGRKNAYKFLLQYCYKRYDREVIILDFLNDIHKKNRAIENIVLDTLSRMLYVDKHLIFSDEIYANSCKYLFGYIDGNTREDEKKGSITIAKNKKKVLDDIFVNKNFRNFNDRFY